MKNIFFVFLLGLISCIKEPITFSSSVAVNNTSHKITVSPFFRGSVNTNAAFELQPNETRRIDELNRRGNGNGITYGYLNLPNDSIVVTFDNQYSIVHYKSTLVGNNPKRYLFASLRNLFNDSSYQSVLKQETSAGKSWEFSYTFTEQDYLDAK